MTGDGRRTALSPGAADYGRDCVEHLVRGQEVPSAPDHPLYRLRAACFVSLKKDGALRGCIGTLTPAEADLGYEIARNARAAAFHDPRFAPVREAELGALVYTVDILSPSEPCSHADLDPAHYGVIVLSGSRRGVLLPDLEGVDTVEAQVGIARQKAGIRPGERCDLERFTVTRCREGEAADTIHAALRATVHDGEVDG